MTEEAPDAIRRQIQAELRAAGLMPAEPGGRRDLPMLRRRPAPDPARGAAMLLASFVLPALVLTAVALMIALIAAP